MINKILQIAAVLALSTSVVYGINGIRLNAIVGDVGEKYEHLLEETLEKKTGFTVSDPHERISDIYAKRYGSKLDPDYDKDWEKTLDNLGFFSITQDEKLNSILKVAPEVAGFAPFNQVIYKKTSENKSYIGHIDPNTMLDIVGTKDATARKEFVAMFESLDKWTQDEFGGTVEKSTFAALPEKRMMNFEITIDRSGDLDDYMGSFEEGFEESFEAKKYIIAGYKNFKESYDDLGMDFDEYDKFFVYSICHFTFSYNVFNKGRPDAGVFAPCSMYMYIKKGSNKMIIGMPMLANWISVMNITDSEKIEWAKKIDSEVISIMKSIGAKEI